MSESEQSGAGRREVAYRLFAAEFDDADVSHSESDEERAPNYVITPSGARVNRLFVVGVLTEVEQVSDDVLRARVVDPTGAFVLYAGQYQPDEQAFLERAEPPAFVAVTGKARTFTPDDSDQVFTSVRPESINEVDAETRDRFTIQAAEQTLERVGHMITALETGLSGEQLRAELIDRGVDEGLASGIALALDHYGTTPTYLDALRTTALDAARLVAGQRDEVTGIDVAPDTAGNVRLDDLSSAGVDPEILRAEEGATTEKTEPPTDQSEATTTASVDDEQPDSVEASTDEQPAITDTETVESGKTEAEDVQETAETSADASENAGSEELGDFEPGDFDGEEFELEAETREQIEEEYGTEFQSGTEVDDPGEADIETPAVDPDATTEDTVTPAGDPDATTEDAETAVETDSTEDVGTTTADAETAETDESDAAGDAHEEQAESAGSLATDDEIQAAVVNVLQELNDGSGVARNDLQGTMTERYDVTESAVEDAIQDALMDGKCWEPDDETLMPI